MVKKCKKLFKILIFVGLVLGLSACRENDSPNVLIIAVEQLNSAEAICHRETNQLARSGFELLCNESIRATHAYLPSTLSVPNLVSLMTGLYPFQHQVRYNSLPGLKAEALTATEVAWNRSYKTSFFSGGLTFLRRSGLHQGFEVFDDSTHPEKNLGFRPLKDTSKLFLDWLQEIGSSQPFFSVLTSSDLLFPNYSTSNFMGETRSLSFESQLDEVDETLYNVFTALQKRNLWDQTLIILTGVSGRSTTEREFSLPSALNLHSESVQTFLMIKPTYKQKDVKSARTFDVTISLADVGRTLFDFLEPSLSFPHNELFPIVSLKSMIQKTLGPWSTKRAIPIEATWLKWQGLGDTRWAFISDQDLILADAKPKVYNTLTDRFENHPLELKDFKDPRFKISPEIMTQLQVQAWRWPAGLTRSSDDLFNKKVKVDWSKKECFKWSLLPQSQQLRRECQNPDFQLYMNWILAEDKSYQKEQARELFLRQMRFRHLLNEFKILNMKLGGQWEPLPAAEIVYDELDEVLRLNDKHRLIVQDDLEKMRKQQRQDPED